MKKKDKFLASEINKEIDSIDTKSKDTTEAPNKKDNKLLNILHSRKFAKGWLSVAIIAVFVACVIAVNIIASVLESKYPNLAFDITGDSIYELQEDTEKFCKGIDQDIKIIVLTTEEKFVNLDNSYMGSDYNSVSYFSQANQFLKKMTGVNSHLSLEYENISSNPSFASTYNKLDLNNTGTNVLIVLDAGDGNYKGLRFDDLFDVQNDESTGYTILAGSKVEQEVCTGILSLTSGTTAKACFIASSGIASEADSQGSTSYTALKALLKNQAYDTSEVDLDTKNNIPDDCDILFLVAPTKDLSENAIEKIEKFLEKAKKTSKTFVYIPYPFKVENGTPNLDLFLEKQGIKVSDELIYEQNDSYLSSVYPNDHRLSIMDYSNQDYIENLDTTSKVLMGDTKALTLTEGSSAVSLLESSKDADILPLDAKSPEDIKEGNGKPLIASAINKSEISSGISKNVLVISSFYAVSDEFLNGYPQYNNSNYFTNLFNSLTDNQGQTVAITSSSKSDTTLNLESSAQTVPPMIIFIFVIPIGVIIAGISTWTIRRKK